MRITVLVVPAVLIVIGLMLWGTESYPDRDVALVHETHTAAETSNAIRDAMLDRKRVAVRYAKKDVVYDPKLSLSDEQKQTFAEFMARRVRLSRAALAKLEAEENSVARELKIAQALANIEIEQTVADLVRRGDFFVTPGYIREARHTEECFFANVQFEGNIVYAPIDLTEFPGVAWLNKRRDEVQAFALADAGYMWNSKPYDERRRLVDEAEALATEVRATSAELLDLEGVQEPTAAQQERLDELRGVTARQATAQGRLPRGKLDVATLEWRNQ
jgi:hypothetical protein